MWRMKILVVSVVVLGALLFGAAVAYAGWGWNAKINIEGTKISTSWSVDDVTGAKGYHAEITVAVPSGTDVNVIKTAPTENVNVVLGGSCSGGDISAVVTYVVTSAGGAGSDVSVSVDQIGHGNAHYGDGTGGLGDEISVNVSISGGC